MNVKNQNLSHVIGDGASELRGDVIDLIVEDQIL